MLLGLTVVDVGVERQRTVLDVEGEGVDIEVAGAHHFDRQSVVHLAITVQVHVRDRWGFVFLHTAKPEERGECTENMFNQRRWC